MSMTNCQSDRYFLVLNITNFTFFEEKGIYITSLLFKSKKDIRKFPFQYIPSQMSMHCITLVQTCTVIKIQVFLID